MKKFTLLLAVLLMQYGCTETVEKIITVEVEKQTSWKEITRFSEEDKIVVSSGRDSKGVYFQQPRMFTEILRQGNSTDIITSLAGYFPADITMKLPIVNGFVPVPQNYNTLIITDVHQTVHGTSHLSINLKEIDTTLTTIGLGQQKMMVINSDTLLLLNYLNQRKEHSHTFMMMKLKKQLISDFVDTSDVKMITIPYLNSSEYFRAFWGVDDYFLIQIGERGLLKIYKDGRYKLVNSDDLIRQIYKWQGKIYAVTGDDKIYISEDDGETWNSFSGAPQVMQWSGYTSVGDSLVGYNQDAIYSLRWNAANYTMRFLKNDGLENKKITGIETLGDSVYVATLSGVFVKPISTFFEMKE